MAAEAEKVIEDTIGARLVWETSITTDHNHAALERHGANKFWVHRKGAMALQAGELGVLPGSMGTLSFHVEGRGCEEALNSSAHGAGRAMSRSEAKRRFTLEDHAKATAGIECRKDADVIDETPAAYKPIEDVMAAQRDLVEIVHTLRQVVCVKG